jgi:hypothetical protein
MEENGKRRWVDWGDILMSMSTKDECEIGSRRE